MITPSPNEPMIPVGSHCDGRTQTQTDVVGDSDVGKITGGRVVVVVVGFGVVVVGFGVVVVGFGVVVVGFGVVVVVVVVAVMFGGRQQTSRSPVHLRYLDRKFYDLIEFL